MLRDKKLAVLGAGMMGGALARGLVHASAMPPSGIMLYDTDAAKAKALAVEIGDSTATSPTPEAALLKANILLVAVKPQMVAEVLAQIAPFLVPGQLIISIAAGVRLVTMEALLPAGTPIIRAMPNTPCLVGAGATALSCGNHATEEHLKLAHSLFSSVGQAVEVPERLLDAVTGLSGSGPAYVYLMIEALTDGGVKEGLPHETARLLAAQTVLGAAQMALASEVHPAQLKANVTTPGGTTIAGLTALERAGFRAALINAVEAAAQRSRELS